MRRSARARRDPAPRAQAPSLFAPLDALLARRGGAVVAVLAIVHAVAFTLLSAQKYRAYLYLDIDLPMFTQAVSGILRGSLFSSIRGMNWLGDHSSLVLFPAALPFALAPHPLTLLALQSAALALGAWPVWALARRELGAGAAPVALAAAWLLHPALGWANLYEFHPELLCSAALLAAFAAWRAERLAPAAAFAALALLGKEDAVLPVGALAVLALLDRGPRRVVFAGTFAALAAASLVLSFAVLKPLLNRGEVEYGLMYARWGTGPAGVAAGLLRDPAGALAAFFTEPGPAIGSVVKQQYYLHLLLPLLFVPVLSPGVLALALPTLATHMLSDRVAQHTIYYQYTAYVLPFVFAAAVLGAARVTSRAGRPAAATPLALAMLAATLACGAMFGPVFGRGVLQAAASEQHAFPTARERSVAAQRDSLVARVPRAGAVVAGSEFLGRFAARPAAHAFLNTVSGTYTYSNKPYPSPTGVQALIADFAAGPLLRFVDRGTGARVRELLRANGLVPVGAAGDNLVFLAGARDTLRLVELGAAPPPVPRRIDFDGVLSFSGDSLLATEAAPGGVLPVRTWWRRVGAAGEIYGMQLGAYDALGKTRFVLDRHLGYLFAPVHDWPEGVLAAETYRVLVPADCAPGTYMLGLRVWRALPEGTAPAATDDRGTLARNGVVELGRFTVR